MPRRGEFAARYPKNPVLATWGRFFGDGRFFIFVLKFSAFRDEYSAAGGEILEDDDFSGQEVGRGVGRSFDCEHAHFQRVQYRRHLLRRPSGHAVNCCLGDSLLLYGLHPGDGFLLRTGSREFHLKVPGKPQCQGSRADGGRGVPLVRSHRRRRCDSRVHLHGSAPGFSGIHSDRETLRGGVFQMDSGGDALHNGVLLPQ